MKHSYLSQKSIHESLSQGDITYKEASELTITLESCAKRSIKVEPTRHGIVTRHQVA